MIKLAVLWSGSKKAAANNIRPDIEPAMIEITLPALT